MSGDPTGPLPERQRADLATSRRIARLMDDVATVPGTGVGVGLDALVGLVPGIGDLAGSTLSGVIVYDAVRCRVPIPALARMGWNLIVDALLGLVPGVGDLIDVAHRANRKNYRLLEQAVEANPYPEPPTVGYLLAAGALVVLPLVFAVALGFVALYFLIRWIAR